MRSPCVRLTIGQVMGVVAVAAVGLALGLTLERHRSPFAGPFVLAIAINAGWVRYRQGLGTAGTAVVALTAALGALQFSWWAVPGTGFLVLAALCGAAPLTWWAAGPGTVRVVACQVMWGIVALGLAPIVALVVSLSLGFLLGMR